MRKKGFTLIELLAVIVILAVIALIAVPLILSLVNKSRLKAAEESALFYVDTIENMLMINNIENTDGKTYKVKGKTVVDENNEVILNLEIKGDTPYKGVTNEIKINSGFVETANLRFNAYYVHYEMNMETKEFKTCTSQKGFLDKCDGTGSVIPSVPDEQKKDGPTIEIATDKTYLAEVYLDPTDISKKCTKEDDNVNVLAGGKKTKVKSGCMKWYAYKEDENNYTMILDHNTSGSVYLKSGGNSQDLVTEVVQKLNQNIESWEDSIKENVRLITADEIAELTGANREDTIKWHSSKSLSTSLEETNIDTEVSIFYLDGTGTTYSKTDGWGKRRSTTVGANIYGWLFDYTNNCTIEGGCNVGESQTVYSEFTGGYHNVNGYWTSTPCSNANRVWYVSMLGSLGFVDTDYTHLGIRPVITIPKSLFS